MDKVPYLKCIHSKFQGLHTLSKETVSNLFFAMAYTTESFLLIFSANTGVKMPIL